MSSATNSPVKKNRWKNDNTNSSTPANQHHVCTRPIWRSILNVRTGVQQMTGNRRKMPEANGTFWTEIEKRSVEWDDWSNYCVALTINKRRNSHSYCDRHENSFPCDLGHLLFINVELLIQKEHPANHGHTNCQQQHTLVICLEMFDSVQCQFHVVIAQINLRNYRGKLESECDRWLYWTHGSCIRLWFDCRLNLIFEW